MRHRHLSAPNFHISKSRSGMRKESLIHLSKERKAEMIAEIKQYFVKERGLMGILKRGVDDKIENGIVAYR